MPDCVTLARNKRKERTLRSSSTRKSATASCNTPRQTYSLVRFPNGETRRMTAGPRTDISKAVIEVFAPTFLAKPSLIFCRQSCNEAIANSVKLLEALGLMFPASLALPDIILVDLGPTHPLLVCVDIGLSDGAIDDARRTALMQIADQAGFASQNVALVTAVLDRKPENPGEATDRLAGGSYAWFTSEPDYLMVMRSVRR